MKQCPYRFSQPTHMQGCIREACLAYREEYSNEPGFLGDSQFLRTIIKGRCSAMNGRIVYYHVDDSCLNKDGKA